jgi:hypothetical protein
MRSRLTGGLALAAVLSAGVAAGCGGGGDHLTRAEFDKQGNAICKKGNQEINKAARSAFVVKSKKKPSGPPGAAQFKKFADDTLIPNVQSQIDQIRDLNPPSADEDQVNAILDAAQSALDKAKKDPTLLENNKNTPFKKANKLANAYGLTVCASS